MSELTFIMCRGIILYMNSLETNVIYIFANDVVFMMETE